MAKLTDICEETKTMQIPNLKTWFAISIILVVAMAGPLFSEEPVYFADIYSLAAPRALQCQNGMLEPVSQFNVPLARRAMEEVRIIYRDLDEPENVILDVHGGAHEIDLPGLRYFFEKHLYGNRWTEPEDIQM
jgi:hypothetical protein